VNTDENRAAPCWGAAGGVETGGVGTGGNGAAVAGCDEKFGSGATG
jgi:hypothetical protein